MSQIHELKIAPHFLNEIAIGNKNFEIRFNDRDFQSGDTLILKGFENDRYTGNEVTRSVDFILSNYPGLEKGYVILSLKPVIVQTSNKKGMEEILKERFEHDYKDEFGGTSLARRDYENFMWAFKRFLADDSDNAFYFIDDCEPLFNFFSKLSPLFLKAILYRESIDFSEITEGKYDDVLDSLIEAIWEYYHDLNR
ncbi:DUF3850 domain-containing protein [Ignatzschineria rhizosphaerae]|uniref:DUF3850 domain-containing protein n=1 Tax=Ignatzschineria rhizosphaerae TaxID=2923279 RepID=A0ABY3WZ50_9GAMM|nr:DUF3850 domain-containing protein [Ignatzschineria rhizosphaerae]UNM95903.1 DUF3850 domain-containing protein [Ignatzschineria rhizosphaerae]